MFLYSKNLNLQSSKLLDLNNLKDIFMQLKYNPQQTNIISTQAAYVQYKKWLQQNGVIVDPRIRYPTYFGDKNKGVVGVSVSKSIQKSRAVIAVPYKLLITMDKVMSIQILDKIIQQNPDVFGVSDYAVMKMLILYVIYELLKEKNSFYYPYFQISKDSYLQKWTHWQMVALQNKQVQKSLKRQKEQLQTFFLQFLRLFTKYDNIFPSDKGNIFYQKLFQRAYNFVTTRAFGWSLPSISLIPMADSLNHGNNYLNHFLIDTLEQKDPQQTYVSRKNKTNLSILKEQNLNPLQNQLTQLRKKRKKRFQKFVQKHKQIITSSKQIGQQIVSNSKIQNQTQRKKQYFILSQQYKSQVRNLRQLHFYETSCSQDNDTDEDDIQEFVIKKQKFEFDQKYKPKVQKETNKKVLINKYWKLWTDSRFNQEEDRENQSQEQEQQDKSNSQTQIQKKQSLKQYQQKYKESEGSSQVSSTQSEEDDENFDWMKSHVNDNYKSCFFVMETRGIVRQNQQIHNFYGRRTNRFLLQSYNFVMTNNQYDSFGFRLLIDSTLNAKPTSLTKLIYGKNKKLGTQKKVGKILTRQIRLKRQRINTQLINHCRCYAIQFQKKQYDNASITIAFDRQIQVKAIKFYREIIQSLKDQYMTSIQDDLQLLQKTVKHELRMAIEFRIMQKQIIQQQLQLIDKCTEYLNKRWKEGRVDKVTWKDMRWMKRIRGYLYQLERGRVL